jgi:hypothetical protein
MAWQLTISKALGVLQSVCIFHLLSHASPENLCGGNNITKSVRAHDARAICDNHNSNESAMISV